MTIQDIQNILMVSRCGSINKAAEQIPMTQPALSRCIQKVERAAKENDTVHLFVLSEDASLVPFKMRWKLVTEGVADLPNVVCHPSGPYIISSATFPSYFLRDEETVIEGHARLDL